MVDHPPCPNLDENNLPLYFFSSLSNTDDPPLLSISPHDADVSCIVHQSSKMFVDVARRHQRRPTSSVKNFLMMDYSRFMVNNPKEQCTSTVTSDCKFWPLPSYHGAAFQNPSLFPCVHSNPTLPAVSMGPPIIKTSDLVYIQELGSGAYGAVYYGKCNGWDVAIKKIKPSLFSQGLSLEKEEKLVADFWKEAHILAQLHHPNIVALYGVVTEGPANNLAVVTQYMVSGSLNQVLQRKDRTMDRRKRIMLAMDAAFGMEYLHQNNIVHFDLKSHNLLVDVRDPQRPMCKIGDLGLSRKIEHGTLICSGARGSVPWMAPELLDSKKKNNMVMVSNKVDVYSFGIVMWELLTGEQPYANLRSKETIDSIIEGTLRPLIPSWCDPTWRSLTERCWSSDPDSRPAFSEIAKELRAMSETNYNKVISRPTLSQIL